VYTRFQNLGTETSLVCRRPGRLLSGPKISAKIGIAQVDKLPMQISAIALNGMEAAQSRLERTATQLAAAPDRTDQVDLSAAAVALIQSRNDFAVNAKVEKTSVEMEKSLIDVLG
jgi:hypothetical protein